MKRLYVLSIALISFFAANSQSLRVTDEHNNPVLLKDVLKAYELAHGTERAEEEENGNIIEDENYHFDRWYWYWKQHLDAEGYMISPAATYLELKKEETRARSKTTTPDQSDWKFRGPTSSPGGYNGIGRVNAIAFHPTNSSIYFAGTSGGGVWKTTNDGLSWSSITDNLPRLDISDIVVNPLNPSTIYICTGDRENSSSAWNNNYSIGVMKTTDGGQTWNATGLSLSTSQYKLTNSLVMNPQDTNSLTLAASDGIHKSYNGGLTWTKVQSGDYKQVIYHPTDSSILYAGRNDGNTQIYRSVDGGATWNAVTSFTNARRITLAVTPASPSTVMAIVCNSSSGLMGIYRSTNSGASFSLRYSPSGSNCNNKTGDLITGNMDGTGCGKQGWYDLALAIKPTNANEMYAGGVNTYGSTDGGATWSLITQWYSQLTGVVTVHADKHIHTFNPLTGDLFEGNDGGIYKSQFPRSGIWTDISNGISMTQFYRNAVTNASKSASVLGGAQDNGTKGLQGGIWYEVTGGDGMECQADPLDSNVFYTATQNGNINRTTDGGNSFTDISDNIPGKPSGGWITPYIITPGNNQGLIAGYKKVYYSSDRGDSWTAIQAGDVTGDNCERLAMSFGTKPTLYAIFPDTQVVFFVKNYIPGNTAVFDTINVPYAGNISDIHPHPVDSGRFYLTFSSYNNALVAEYNKGTWKQMNAGLPNVPVRCFEYDTARNVMYAGTDLGVYYIDSATNGIWAPFKTNMPAIEISDLGINYTTKDIWAATYGRGMWSSVAQGSVIVPDTTDTSNSVVIIPYADDVFNIAPNPSSGQFKIIAGPSVSTGKAIRVNVIDYTGKTVLSKETVFDGGRKMEVDAEQLPSGVYIVELEDNYSVLGRKRVVIR